MRKRLVLVVAAVLAVALVAAGVVWWLARPSTELEQAVSWAPEEGERLTWTHWSAIRTELGADLDDSSGVGAVQDFLDEGYEKDLTSTSALLGSAQALHQRFGFSPATLEWELLSQSASGTAVLMRLSDETDPEELADGLEQLGYERPDEETGVWRGGPDLLATLGPELTPELQYLALDADRGLLVASDTADYLAGVVDGLGEGDGPAGLEDVVAGSGEPLTAAVYTGDHACSALAMGTADPADQAEADQLVAAAGEVNPVTGFAMSAQPGGEIRVVLSFENDDQARTNADSRSVLASGPAPGQGGDFSERFSVDSVTADGSVVTMDLDPVEGGYVISDLSTGPVLFATC